MSHLVVSHTANVRDKQEKKGGGTSRRWQYDKKVKSLKVNILRQVHNLKIKRKFGASWVVLCRGRSP